MIYAVENRHRRRHGYRVCVRVCIRERNEDDGDLSDGGGGSQQSLLQLDFFFRAALRTTHFKHTTTIYDI